MAREVIERKLKQNVRAPKNAKKAGIGKMAMNTIKSKSEKRTTQLKGIHEKKIDTISRNVNSLKASLPDERLIQTDIASSSLHIRKILITARNMNFSYFSKPLWKDALNF